MRLLLIDVPARFGMSNLPREVLDQLPRLRAPEEPPKILPEVEPPTTRQRFPRAPKFLRKGARR